VRDETPANARPEKDRSGKSEGVPGHALPTLRLPDSTGRTTPNQYDSSALPKVQDNLHHQRVTVSSDENVRVFHSWNCSSFSPLLIWLSLSS
jgi:hypothetical protein